MTAPAFTPRRVRKQRKRALVVAGIAGVVVSVALVAATFALAVRSDDPQVHLGDDVFVVGRVDSLVAPIERDGPLLFQDLLGRSRDLFVQHLGDDPEAGWTAFEATAPGAGRHCQLQWDGATSTFRDPCSGLRYAADGTGLRHYAAEIGDDGRLRVDLRRPATPSTSAPPAATD